MKRLNLFIAFSLALSAVVFLACSKEDTTLITTSEKSENVKATDRSIKDCCGFTLAKNLNLPDGVTASVIGELCNGGVCNGHVQSIPITNEATTSPFSFCPGSKVKLVITNNSDEPFSGTILLNSNKNAAALLTCEIIDVAPNQFTRLDFDPCFDQSFYLANQ